jgi:hypothetical protein
VCVWGGVVWGSSGILWEGNGFWKGGHGAAGSMAAAKGAAVVCLQVRPHDHMHLNPGACQGVSKYLACAGSQRLRWLTAFPPRTLATHAGPPNPILPSHPLQSSTPVMLNADKEFLAQKVAPHRSGYTLFPLLTLPCQHESGHGRPGIRNIGGCTSGRGVWGIAQALGPPRPPFLGWRCATDSPALARTPFHQLCHKRFPPTLRASFPQSAGQADKPANHTSLETLVHAPQYSV